jgi:hypothetical protein
MPEIMPNEVVTLLDRQLSHELIKKIIVGQSAYYIVEEVGEHDGGLLVVRLTPGSKPEVVIADTSLVTPDGSSLPREVYDEIEAIFGKPAVDVAEGILGLQPPNDRPTTRQRIRQLVFNEVRKQNGHLSSRNVPGTNHGHLACAWAENEIVKLATGKPIGGGLSVKAMRKVLGERHTPIPESNAKEGGIIISCTPASTQGHVGFIGEAGSGGQGRRKIYSNSSSKALFVRNYTIDSWKASFQGRERLKVEFFELNPSQFA